MKKRTRIKLIYIRYILPPVMLVLTLLSMLIPSYRYAIDGKLDEPLSPFKILSNGFDTARKVVFATTEQDAAELLFSQTAMAMIIAFWALFLIAFAVAVYSAAVVLYYIKSDDEAAREKSRTLFITLIPNRIVLCALQMLAVPLALFPYLLPYLYKSIWGQRIGMALVLVPDALIVVALTVVTTVTLCILSSFCEKELDVDVFRKRKAFEDGENDETESYDAPQSSNTSEQNEMIRRILLGGKNNEENTENKDKTED